MLSTRNMAYAASALAIAMACQADEARAQDAGAGMSAIGSPEPALESPTDEIMVTGSRIAQRDLVSASPIVTVSPEIFKQNGSVTLEESMNRLPQLVPARGATSNDGLTGGITTLDLRGLGSNRTLVLMDSRRLQASTPLGAVDINNIPSALIKNVEVVTGGASAAYGSDAIAGVVNFNLDHQFTGLRVDAQTGISERGDGFQVQASVTAGGAFDDDRGHAQFSINYAKREGIANSARDFSRIVRPSSSISTGAYVPNATNLPTQAAMNGVFGSYGVANDAVPRTAGFGFNVDGSLFSYQANAFNYRGGGSGLIITPSNIRYNSSGVAGLTIPYERFGAYGHVDYALTEAINFYGEINFSHFTSSAYYAPAFATVSIPVSNPFISPDLRTILASRPNPNANFDLTRRFAEVGLRTAETTTNNSQVRLGLKGPMGVLDWTWDLYASYGRSDQTQRDENGISASALARLVTAADGGRSACDGGLNLFGPQGESACATYLRRNTLRDSQSEQKVFEGTIQGGLFSLPAGEVRFAVGADYRSDSFSFDPDAALQSGDVISFATGAVPSVNGEVSAKEVYAELSVPVLSNLPLIRKLTLGGGYRFSDYNITGSIHSYRGDINWEVIDFFRLRGGYSRSVRSPSIQELFAPTSATSPSIGSAGTVGQGDPCDIRSAYRTGSGAAAVRTLCLAQGVPANIIDSYTFNSIQLTEGGLSGGNIGLKPEVADTFTVGGVLTPDFGSPFVTRFSLSVDYYNIRLNRAVATVNGATAIQRCYNLAGTNANYVVDNVYCGLFGRSSTTGQINSIALYNLNIGAVQTSGIDIALGWIVDVEEAGVEHGGKLAVNVAATKLLQYDIATLPGESPTDFAGYAGDSARAFPDWKLNATLAYTNGPATISLQYRYLDSMIDSSVAGLASTAGFEVPSRSYFDLGAVIQADDVMTFRFGVNNLTDKMPPLLQTFDQSNTLPTVYDVIGRSFYLSISKQF